MHKWSGMILKMRGLQKVYVRFIAVFVAFVGFLA